VHSATPPQLETRLEIGEVTIETWRTCSAAFTSALLFSRNCSGKMPRNSLQL
jgi:hypothetical protein